MDYEEFLPFEAPYALEMGECVAMALTAKWLLSSEKDDEGVSLLFEATHLFGNSE